ncbi:TIGR01906 family membrane protein [Clostridium omnivorum]|uniref:Membrane protein n=1 Tax=Clostridium omnivorum TaxID=1604902 RepID=A0ABQ5N8C9_9CLOT|nr:TIGR01906 family membrane protein [Clostridium sp. E14]GLC31396.1 membrane protein [Clostridium sp. E14]
MNKTTSTLLAPIFSIAVSIFIVTLAVKFTLGFRPLYYYDVNHLNIAESSGIDKNTIIKNYNILIDYTQKPSIKKLSMPDFTMSKEGEIHFVEVKKLFTNIDYLFYISTVISAIAVFIGFKSKNFVFLKRSATNLIVMPILLIIPFAINFNKSFTVFHKLFFSNDYWEFDPVKDPIINVLPEDFFFHCALLILGFIVVSCIILFLLYRLSIKKGSTHNKA